MRNSYEVRAQKFIQQIANYIKNCEDYCDLEEAVCNFMMDNPRRKVAVSHGMARMVIITSDYVIKLNYNQEWVESVGGCEEEMDFYSIAESEGMGHLFAKISAYMYGNRTYYIMPRVRGVNEWNWHSAYYYMTPEENKWCRHHGLNDLHSGNFGFRNGHVCIFDYGCIEE